MNEGVGRLVHLPGRGPVDLDASSVRLFMEPEEEVAEPAIEQWLAISIRCAVGIELQEEIVADCWGQIEPPPYPRHCRQVVTGNLPGLQSWHQPAGETQAERPSDHQQVTLLASADRGLDPVIEGPRLIVGVIRAPVYLIDYSSL